MNKKEWLQRFKEKMATDKEFLWSINMEIVDMAKEYAITQSESKKMLLNIYFHLHSHFANDYPDWFSETLWWLTRDCANFLVWGSHPSEQNHLVSGKNSFYFEDDKAYVNGHYVYFNLEDSYAMDCGDIFENKSKSALFSWNRK